MRAGNAGPGTYMMGALALLALCLALGRLSPGLIDLLPLADRQHVVMQASALNLPETTASALGHVQFALLAAAGLLLGLAIHRAAPRWPEVMLDHPALPLSALLLGLMLWYAFERSLVIDGVRYFYLDDDAMITMRYARNFARGLGPVWNAGERVEGYTNFLWMLVMTGVHLAGFPETTTSLAMMLINWGLVAATLFFIQAALRALHVGRVWIFLACLAFACDVNVLHWASSGLESSLMALLVAVCGWALLRGRDVPFLVALALIPLARADAALLAAALGLVYLWPRRDRRAFGLLVVAALPALAQIIFRVLYYGELLPNTYYLKMTGIDDRVRIGVSYTLRLIHLYPVGLLALVLVAVIEPKLRFAAWVWAAQIVYIVYAGGDTFWLLRPFVAVLPLLYTAAGLALDRLTSGDQPVAARLALGGLFVLSVPAMAGGGVLFANPQQEEALFGGQVQVMARMIEVNVPPDLLISIEPAGSIPYFAQDHRFVDALGKNDAHIARLDAHPGNTLIGHNKFDWDYVYGARRPELVLASCVLPDIWIPLPASIRAMVYDEAGRNGLAYLPYQILHPDFEALYYPNRVYYLEPSPREEWIICAFARESGLVPPAWALPGSLETALRVDFDTPVSGGGWHRPDVWDDGRTVQWTGPQTASTLYLPVDTSAPAALEMCVFPIQPAVLDSLQMRANEMPLTLETGTHPDCDGVYLSATIAADDGAYLALAIGVSETVVPDSFSGNGDLRPLGLAFDWLRVSPR